MSIRHFIAAVVIAMLACSGRAAAQFGTSFPGFVTLPDQNFTWLWGSPDERDMRRTPDFDIRGTEASFRCQLVGKLLISSRMSRNDIRSMERSLRSSISFIQAASNTMNVLDRQGELDWARLACEKLDGEISEDEAQERLDRAVERAIRERERRRARESEDD